MHILLTGGSGSVGKAIVEALVKGGHDVLVIGRSAGIQFSGARYEVCDINDYPHLREIAHGRDAIVHLAAVPNPGVTSPEELFRINTSGTFNVFQAAAEEGIRRVIQASSINAAGQFYGVKPAMLHYLPLDEAHPVFSTDAYSFSKHIIEEIGEYFWRREGISSAAFRLPWVASAEMHEHLGPRRATVKGAVERLLPLEADQRRAWFATAWAEYNEFRAARPYEKPDGHAYRMIGEMPEEQRVKISLMSNRANFFTMLDERDSAAAVVNGLSASFEGAHALYINDGWNWTGIESPVLADLFFPDVKMFKGGLSGYESLVSIAKARALIGFEPKFSFAEGTSHD